MVSEPLTITLPVEVIATIVTEVTARVLESMGTLADDWPAFMSLPTIARYLDMPVQRVRKLVAARKIPYLQEAAGCRIFFDRDAIDEWMRTSAR